MRPLEFYELGLRIAAAASTEGEYRSVISRIYYGLHHEACCRYFRRSVGLPLRVNGRHRELCHRLYDLGDPAATEAGQHLDRLLRLREQADYEIASRFRVGGRALTPDEAMRHSLAIAGRLLAALDRLSPGAAPDGCRCPAVWSTR